MSDALDDVLKEAEALGLVDDDDDEEDLGGGGGDAGASFSSGVFAATAGAAATMLAAVVLTLVAAFHRRPRAGPGAREPSLVTAELGVVTRDSAQKRSPLGLPH
mmetsp:Transcript_71528/g.207317  ORF Transcript_71528/g.207317 Transcript_71528/m.207317 type:complete len:104 (-) Transcript_71528:323-634(-)